MSAIRGGFTIALALMAQTTLARFLVDGDTHVDLVLVAVILAALSGGSIVGLWTGTVGGLFQDVLSGGIVGVSGLAKSIVGVLVGVVVAKFVVSTIWHRAVILVLATITHALCFFGVYAFLESVGPIFLVGGILAQAITNAIVGIAAVALINLVPTVIERGPFRRASLSRRWNVGRGI